MLKFREPVNYEELLADLTLTRLNEIFRNCLKRQEDKVDPVRSHFGRIEKDEVNIDAKANYVAGYIRSHKRMNFRELLENQKSRMDVIVTFLVVLELMKTGVVSVEQESIEDDIIITTREIPEDGLEFHGLTSLGDAVGENEDIDREENQRWGADSRRRQLKRFFSQWGNPWK